MKIFLFSCIEKLESLDESTQPVWGKMTLQHMVEHLILTVKCSNGKFFVSCSTPPEKLPTLKRILLSDRQLPKNFVNPVIGTRLVPLDFENLESAITALKKEIDDYFKIFEENPGSMHVNPTFGELNKDEWDIFHKKHFRHHFEQFGIICNSL